MRMGVREICEVVLRAKGTQKLGRRTFLKDEPVLYFDTLKTSSLEGAATTVYATGGRGNSRLLAWEGERTMTFVMEDALISPESFAILSGAGLIEATADAPIFVHSTLKVEVNAEGRIVLKEEDGTPIYASWSGDATDTAAVITAGKAAKKIGADIYCMKLDDGGETITEPCIPATVEYTTEGTVINCDADGTGHILGADGQPIAGQGTAVEVKPGDIVLVDFYVMYASGAMQIDITPDQFGGYYYLEAATLFRRERDGKDLPAEFIIPKCKVQSNFTFTMAATGDPSTFTFTLDAFPDYTKFNRTKKVLACLQVVDDAGSVDNYTREACDGVTVAGG